MVPGKGVEPLSPYERSALNAMCLPISPSRHICLCKKVYLLLEKVSIGLEDRLC